MRNNSKGQRRDKNQNDSGIKSKVFSISLTKPHSYNDLVTIS